MSPADNLGEILSNERTAFRELRCRNFDIAARYSLRMCHQSLPTRLIGHVHLKKAGSSHNANVINRNA
jgi:hypothetical protein